jgi:Ice-binding-like
LEEVLGVKLFDRVGRKLVLTGVGRTSSATPMKSSRSASPDGALAKNIFWQVSGRVNLGTTARLEGHVLAQTAETLGTGASINGSLAQTAVNIDGSTVTEPAP